MLKRLKVSWFFIGFILVMIFMGLAMEIACLLLALIIHETGHILAAKILGCGIEKLLILPLGGYLFLDQLIEVQPQVENRIAMAGPAANLLAVAVVMAAVKGAEQPYILIFLRANLTLMTFNLLPALPLDGGRVLRAHLSGWIPFYRATQTVIFTGAVSGFLLLSLGVWGLVQGRINPTIIAAAVFLLYNAYVEKKQLLVPLFRYILRRQHNLRGAKFIAAHILVAAPGARVNEVLKHIRPQKYYQISVLDHKFKVCGTLTEHQLLNQITSGTGQQLLTDVVEKERME